MQKYNWQNVRKAFSKDSSHTKQPLCSELQGLKWSPVHWNFNLVTVKEEKIGTGAIIKYTFLEVVSKAVT